MPSRLPVSPSPGPLEHYPPASTICPRSRPERGLQALPGGTVATRRAQQDPHRPRQHRAGCGAQRKQAQSLQWFLSESGWQQQEVNELGCVAGDGLGERPHEQWDGIARGTPLAPDLLGIEEICVAVF
jgi:hypothetical protein